MGSASVTVAGRAGVSFACSVEMLLGGAEALLHHGEIVSFTSTLTLPGRTRDNRECHLAGGGIRELEIGLFDRIESLLHGRDRVLAPVSDPEKQPFPSHPS